MDTKIVVLLVGASTYATLSKVYTKGTSYEVTPAEWDNLQREVNPSTGAQMFATEQEIASIPSTVESAVVEVVDQADENDHDLQASGLGDVDTGVAPPRKIVVGGKHKAVVV